MTRDYSKGIIYKIVCNDETVTDIYVGSTTDFVNRKSDHKRNVEREIFKLKVHKTIYDNGGWENWSMVKIELYPCDSSTELRIREEYWRKTLQASLNQRLVYSSSEEKLKIAREKQRVYYHEHRDQVLKYQKQYQLEHAEEKREYLKQYHKQNADKVKAQKAQPFECPCDSVCRISDKVRHEKSLKHQNWLKKT